jgi:homoserine kinase type II
LKKRIKSIIETFYDIGNVRDVYEIFGGFSTRGFGVHTRADDRENTFFVRQYEKGAALEEIRFEHALISHAVENGLTICAGVVPCRDGKTMVQPQNSDHIFAVYEYLAGEEKCTWSRTELTDIELANAASVLAEFHNAVRDFDPGHFRKEEPPIIELLPRITENLIHLGNKKNNSKFHCYCRDNLKAILSVIDRHPIMPKDIEGLPVIPTHYDFHPGNLKWDDEVVSGIFDFGWSKMDLRLFDVSMAVIYFCSQWRGGQDGTMRMDTFSHFLKSYHCRLQGLKGLDPLSRHEQRLLPNMLAVANIYLVHWEVSNFYNAKEAVESEYLAYLAHNVRLMRWLDTHGDIITSAVADALGPCQPVEKKPFRS